MRLFQIILLLFASLFFLDSIRGQSPNGTMSGVVTDSSGAAIVEAEILVENYATGAQHAAKTNGEGLFLISGLPPGVYRLQVSKVGFKTLIKPDITLNVQDAVAINFTLPIGAVSETVTITGGAPLVNTQDAAIGTVIDRQFVQNIPLNGQSFNVLLQLTPGTVIVPSSSGAPGQFSINGQRTNANSFQVDGAGANFGTSTTLNQAGAGGTQAFNAYGGTASLVSVDAVQEFRVQTSSFAPEYGRTPGGQVSITTRSGTNQFNGDVFNYFRNTVLDANNWFNNASIDPKTGHSIPRAPEQQNDFGGVLGGRIIRDRTFFFVSYEGLGLRQPQTQEIEVPSLSLRQAQTTAPIAAAILNAYPLPAATAAISPDGTMAQFTGSYSNRIAMDAGSLRVDQVVNSKLNLFGRFNDSPSLNIIRSDSLSTLQNLPVNTKTLTLGADATLSGSSANSFRFNYSKQEASQTSELDAFGGAVPVSSAVLLPAQFSTSDSNSTFAQIGGVPALTIGTAASNAATQWNLVDDFSFLKGPHELKFGANFNRILEQGGALAFRPNYFVFGSLQQFASSATVQVVQNVLIHPSKILFDEFSLYAQDRWMATPCLTLTYGIRWELNPPPTGRNTVLASWLNVDDLPNTRLAPIGTPIWQTRYANFAPRVGLAYRLTSKGDLVLRGGTGIFYDLGTGIAPLLTQYFPNVAQFFAFGAFSLPIADPASITPSFSLNPPFPPQTAGFSPNLQLPYSFQWNVALEKSLFGAQSLSVTYVGQLGRRQLRQSNLAPNPSFSGQFFLTTNADTSDYNALQVQFKRAMSRGLQALVNYTWSHAIDTSSSDADAGVPSVSAPIAGERGSSAFDVRHNFTGAFVYAPPSIQANAALKAITESWSLSGSVLARSGFPINIFSTVVLNGAFENTRPDLVPGQPIFIRNASAPGGKTLNPAAFATPPTPRQGTLPRNSIYGFGATQVDASLQRVFPLAEKNRLQFRVDAFNLLNHPNFANPQGHFPGPQFGMVTQMLSQGLQSGAGNSALNPLYNIGGPRSLQLSLKLFF